MRDKEDELWRVFARGSSGFSLRCEEVRFYLWFLFFSFLNQKLNTWGEKRERAVAEKERAWDAVLLLQQKKKKKKKKKNRESLEKRKMRELKRSCISFYTRMEGPDSFGSDQRLKLQQVYDESPTKIRKNH
jgi:hypothetical protein